MGRKKATWRQAELKLSYGSELWVIVRHRSGWFRVPIDSSVELVLWGIACGWQDSLGETSNWCKDPVRPDSRNLVRMWEGESPEGASTS